MTRNSRLRPWTILLVCAIVHGLLPATTQAQKPAVGSAAIDFSRDIRPILSENCFACHGPDESQRKAKLRLDTRGGALAKLRGGGHAVVPGKVSESALVQRILSADVEDRMPPPKTNKKLTATQIDLLKRWIEQDAPYAEHWAFVAPKRPTLPPVKQQDWVRNGIDRFILARLEKEGLQPSPEADRTTLIRRLTFDLTGLPPTPAEIDAFLTDKMPTRTRTSSIGCLRRRTTASGWRSTGSTPPASPTRTATTSTPAGT